jgi:hypothetical protein
MFYSNHNLEIAMRETAPSVLTVDRRKTEKIKALHFRSLRVYLSSFLVLIYLFEQKLWDTIKPPQPLYLQNLMQHVAQQRVEVSVSQRQRLLVLAQFPPPFLEPALFSSRGDWHQIFQRLRRNQTLPPRLRLQGHVSYLHP